MRAQEQRRRFNEELESKVTLRTEQILVANNELQALLQSIPDMVVRVNRSGVVISYQPAKGDTPLAGLNESEVTEGRRGTAESLRTLIRTVGEKTLAANASVVAEHELATSASPVAVELRTAPISRDEYVVFVRDVTARKRFEAEMTAMLEKEHQISAMKSRFISVTSHEFRTPMAAALGSVELLTNHFDRLSPPKRGELLGRIAHSLQRMTHMLDEILVLNRMDANRVEVRLAPVELAGFARSVVEEIRLGDKVGHPIELECTGATAGFITDADLLHHILGNIVSNAIRYSPAGSPVRVRLAVEAGTLRFIVEDQGMGIPAADLHRIFEAFERGSNIGNIMGTGLGLNIVKRMVDMLHGEIAVSSTLAGSCFTVTLPDQTITPLPS
jgi:signal transduction histidine kinase